MPRRGHAERENKMRFGIGGQRRTAALIVAAVALIAAGAPAAQQQKVNVDGRVYESWRGPDFTVSFRLTGKAKPEVTIGAANPGKNRCFSGSARLIARWAAPADRAEHRAVFQGLRRNAGDYYAIRIPQPGGGDLCISDRVPEVTRIDP